MDKKCIGRGWIWLSVLFLISGLSGCGGEYAARTGEDAVSGSSVSGQAVSNSYRFATDTNYYTNYVNPDSGNFTICQYRLDMTEKKEISLPHKDVDGLEVICVEDGFLYYLIVEEKKGEHVSVSKIFRAPIEKDAEGYDVVKIKEKEHILTETKTMSMYSIYINSRYICYLRGEWGKEEFVKYDRKTGKELPVEKLPIETKREKTVTGDGDWIFVMNMNEICFQKLDETKWHKIERKEHYPMIYNKNAIFGTDTDGNGQEKNIYKCDLEDGKWQSFVPIEELEKAARTAIGPDQIEQLECRVIRMSWQGDRLYIQAFVTWMEDGTCHVRSLFFYKGEEDDTVCYEKRLSDCVHSHADSNVGKWANVIKEGRAEIVLEDASCLYMLNGKVFLTFYNHEKEEGRFACYELDTGDFRWLTKEDAEYYEPCYGTIENWCFYDSNLRSSDYDPAGYPSMPNVMLPDGLYVRQEQ